MWRHYLTLHGPRGQASIQQARYCPNQFQVEYQGKDPVNRVRVLVRVGMFTNWKAYAMAYATVNGKRGLKRFPERRIEDIGF